ncbi:metallophosphoesterase family protein [Propylenella binzhouense]|uniref:Metallophosphoesterase n=1 Tax=Propylenella binzhouense TaxID=2555902 RepID=A0A964T7I8_9HYPH|nr:metallophosphoesterase family protein [Propylenella binzhouense]MYZ49259.1 metallophosphoesterase [Propylenella binzhouense]
MATFFTSDTHFGDPRVLRLDKRPFPSVAAHDEALFALWNETVGPDDVVWHLGDFARGDAERISALLARLNGRKHLIVGNNDPEATTGAPEWLSVEHYRELTVDGVDLVLCHYPFRTWNGMGRRRRDLHGHSHGRLSRMTGQYDVGVDAWNFRPVALATILARRSRARPA